MASLASWASAVSVDLKEFRGGESESDEIELVGRGTVGQARPGLPSFFERHVTIPNVSQSTRGSLDGVQAGRSGRWTNSSMLSRGYPMLHSVEVVSVP